MVILFISYFFTEIFLTLFILAQQIDEDLTARISMQDVRYSFQDHTKVFRPNWMSPESEYHFLIGTDKMIIYYSI